MICVNLDHVCQRIMKGLRYSDDVTLKSKCDSDSDLWQQFEFESDLGDIVDWGRKWRFYFSAGKTQLVSFEHLNNCETMNLKMYEPNCYLDVLYKLQKQVCRTVGPILANFFESLAHCQNIANASPSYGYNLVDFYSTWLN